mgnify:CR=1 FL=1
MRNDRKLLFSKYNKNNLNFKKEKPNNSLLYIKERIIPLNLFQTWYTLDLPPKMRINVELLKKQNPEFTHYLYDDNMCREFIKDNFHKDVLYAFDKLKPGTISVSSIFIITFIINFIMRYS